MSSPRLAAFPKAYLDALCVTGEMSVYEWIELGSSLDVDGLEMYADIAELRDPRTWPRVRAAAADAGVELPMLCCSPDFTHPDPEFRRLQIEREKWFIDMAASLGAAYCRVLSGQNRVGISRIEGLRYAAEGIAACLPYAEEQGITLIIENHYKDPYWENSEFAQKIDVFCDLLDVLPSRTLAVNFDPSNTLIAGEDPIELLRRVAPRVATMHASDRYLSSGTFADLQALPPGVGYSDLLRHGEIGKGLIDYDSIFLLLRDQGFSGWISIEDGVDGFDQLVRSAAFLREKIARYWPVVEQHES